MKTHLDRYRQIAEILYRNGFGYLVAASGLENRLPFRRKPQPSDRPRDTANAPVYLRRALEELGPTFVKMGQLLSTRQDLLPPKYQEELTKLQDKTEPVPWEQIKPVLQAELGTNVLERFSTFDTSPLASASIGQVYAARLRNGADVVVKIRRPGVEEEVNEDLDILQGLAGYAGRHWEAARDYDIKGLMEEFAETLREELDYQQEARNTNRFALNFKDSAVVQIPVVYADASTSKVLTQQRLYGLKVTDTAAIDAAGIDRKALAADAADAEMKMVFDDGFFHADPHPGNIFVEKGGRIGLIDFGMVGEVDDRLRTQLSALFIAVIRKDAERMASALIRMCPTSRRVDRIQLRLDLQQLIRLYEGKTIGNAPVGRIINAAMAIIRTHHLQLPREMALLLRMLIMTEGMGEVLDPDFSMGETLAPYARRMTMRQLNPVAFVRRLGQAGAETLELSAELPDQVRRLLTTLDFEGLEIHLRAEELAPLIVRLEKVGNRMVAAIFAAAFIRGVGELALGDSDRWKSWQAPLMTAGLASTGALGGYLAWTARKQRLASY
ncbi:AarF/ABC1/UbiB kinase family protein [Arthrobacter gengyunqii]|uniref:AarF/ABC1/UbiB kinase family protein n=1 Tax=Arthrobacter gengyunqii TaxID=2886940 RepID=A0A9X1S6M2_9MICC|nr:AarF/ABC1/UbiB kinase family protein [Arthrobacter gengyunqii]MCC3265059.1 AarF/ABC1/UbiB kinase family protein [Arthrobacter gengyunqii]MCC3269246.1 AarF/ABC1/UbiB kinase family protein [Arthrobacter gengyunqii]UOY94798.1 AarF/ABC1/UbiB kinase family protein [Arthrobacter gengyunqii]